MSWSPLQLTALAISGFIALQCSYVHPDEHFQSLEVLAVRYLGVNGSLPWEFEQSNAARSFVPLLFNHGPLYFIILNNFKVRDSMTILGLVRLQNFLIYIALCQLVFKRLSETRGVDVKRTNFFIATSYLTCSFQSHSFSNSLETILLLLVLALYNELILDETKRKVPACQASMILGFLIMLGVFNRITFPAFILLPSLAVFWYYYRSHKFHLVLLTFVSLICCLIFVEIDTVLYQSSEWVIPPLNNLLYNFDESNLQLHGLHPRYNHMLLNLPQIMGPAFLFLNPRSMTSFTRNLPLLSVLSGLLLLSAFKHQELRFLIPLAPQLFSCFDDQTIFKSIRSVHVKRLWLIFNLFLAIVMGIYHQGGILRVISYFQRDDSPLGVHIWWKTYSPPTWMYMNDELTTSTTLIKKNIESIDLLPFEATKNHIVDLKGCDVELLNTTLHQFLRNGANVNLIAPNSVKSRLETLSQFLLVPAREEKAHLDLDHLDFGDLSTFAPGITVYNVSLL